jgi:nicotinamidase-related amidase
MSTHEAKILKLTCKYHHAYPRSDPVGRTDEVWEFPLDKTGFVPLHLWNLGTPGGPPCPEMPVGCCGNIDLTNQVLDEYVKPCLDAAREAGMTVFHVEPDLIANKYPISNLEWKPTDIPPYPGKWGSMPQDKDAEGPQRVAPEGDVEATWKDVIPGWRMKRLDMVLGPGRSTWEGFQEMDIVESCKPIDGEYVIKTSQQFDRICRKLGVVNLIYVGFTANGCIQYAPGGVSPMASRGYRVMIIREATLGIEFPDTVEKRLVTQLAIRNIEHKFGFSIGAADFIRTCKAVS